MLIQFCIIGTPTWYQIEDNWYFIRKKFTRFSEAKLLCEEHGAKLFEPNSLHIQNTILDIFRSSSIIWLGITKTEKYQGESKWQWLSNNKSLTNWALENAENARSYRNDFECLYLSRYLRTWRKTNCEYDKQVICEKSTPLKSDVIGTISNGTNGLFLEILPSTFPMPSKLFTYLYF